MLERRMRTVIYLLLALSMSACVQVNTEIEKAESQLAISSVHDRELQLDQHSTFAFTPLQQNENGAVFPMVTAEIEMFLKQKGFQLVTPEQQPTFYIGYILERENELSDEQLSETFGLNPGLPDLPELEKGTMLVFVLDGESKQFVWRAAAQGFVLDDLDAEQKKLRLQQVVHSTLNQFNNN